MDNRLKFLYRVHTELRGHRRIGGPGIGKTGVSAKPRPDGKSAGRWRNVMPSEIQVAKPHESTLSRKAAIDYYVPVPQTDTGRRGENPQPDGRSVVKELGKMAP